EAITLYLPLLPRDRHGPTARAATIHGGIIPRNLRAGHRRGQLIRAGARDGRLQGDIEAVVADRSGNTAAIVVSRIVKGDLPRPCDDGPVLGNGHGQGARAGHAILGGALVRPCYLHIHAVTAAIGTPQESTQGYEEGNDISTELALMLEHEQILSFVL